MPSAFAIGDIAAKLRISTPAFEATASEILLRAKGLPRFSDIQLQAASVYASCRLFGIPRTLKEVSAASGTRAAEIAHCYRKILRNTHLEVRVEDSARFVSGIASRVGLDACTERRALGIVKAAKKSGVTAGRHPAAVAAAALYAAYRELDTDRDTVANLPVTQRMMADAAGVSERTLGKGFRALQSVVSSMERKSAEFP